MPTPVIISRSVASDGGSSVSVTNGSALIAAANPSRQRLTITNKSTTAMLTLALGKAAVSGEGALVLYPAEDATHPGGSVDIISIDAVYGVMSAADATPNNVGKTEV